MPIPLALSIARALNRYEFADALENAATSRYLAEHPTGQVQTFEFKGASYLFDNRAGVDRTILAMSPPTPPVLSRDPAVQRGYPLSASATGRAMDRGHFIPHSAGGDFGPNIFPQDAALNRGWSPDGRAYRALERTAITAGPEALLFVRPVYIDETSVPEFVELGFWAVGNVTSTVFRNRYDDAALGDADRFQAALGGATNRQVGALGEDTALMLLEDQGVVILGTGEAVGRDGHRQGLDILALIDDEVVAYEVKTRLVGNDAGVRTQAGNLRRPRMRTTSDGRRQASEEYVDVRANRIIDAGPDDGHSEVRVMAIDLVLMLAQEFTVARTGRVGPPVTPPTDCEVAARQAYDHIIGHRGYL